MICVPLKAKSERELIALIKKAEKRGAQAIEIWLDHLQKIAEPQRMFAQIRKTTKLPLIFVNKPKREKGKWTGSEEERIEFLKLAAKAKANYVDIGIDTDAKLIRVLRQTKSKSKLILSYHNFTSAPHIDTLKKIFKKMRAHAPAVYKFAVMPKNPRDTIRMLDFLKWIRGEKVKYAIICMGRYGEFLRQISENLGNAITYAALDENHKTAPGQQILNKQHCHK